MRTSLLEKWLAEKNSKELHNAQWMIKLSLKQWKKIYDEMEEDKESSLWDNNCFIAIHKEYKKLLKLSKTVEKFLKENPYEEPRTDCKTSF